MTNTHLNAYVTSIQAEHRELGCLLHEIEKCVMEASECACDTTAACKLVEALESLQSYLAHHFAMEEEGGYMEDALALAPRFSQQARRLQAQHPTFLFKLGKLLELARSLGEGGAGMCDVRSGATDLFKMLRAHEAGENRILEQAFNTDLGLGD